MASGQDSWEALPKASPSVDSHILEEDYVRLSELRRGKMELRPDQLELQDRLNAGTFGSIVWRGMCKLEGRKPVPVVIKTLKKENTAATEVAEPEILEEARLMKELDHRHIVRMIGVCRSDVIMLVLELAPLGELKKYLSRHKDMSTHNIVELMGQVAEGMAFLEERKIFHGNLAARNVLLMDEHFAKISNFEMSNALQEEDENYYEEMKPCLLPLKWSAIEYIRYRQFDSKSDVWSYGVTLWEAMSYGANPYAKMKNVDVIDFLESGQRLSKPLACPDSVYAVMYDCWMEDQDKRPHFKELVPRMKKLLAHDTIQYRRCEEAMGRETTAEYQAYLRCKETTGRETTAEYHAYLRKEEKERQEQAIAEKEAIIEDLKAKLESAKEEMRSSVQKYDDRISKIIKESQAVQQQKAEQDKEMQELQRSISSLQKEPEEKTARLKEVQQTNDDLSSLLKDQEGKIVHMQTRVQEAEATHAVLQKDKEVLQTQVETLQDAEKELLGKNFQLQQCLDKKETQLGRAVSKHLEEMEEMKRSKELLKGKLLMQDQQVRQLEKACQEMKGKVQASEEMVMALKDEQAEAREALYKQMKKLHLEQGDMKQLMDSYSRDLQQGQTEIATVVECISTRQSAHYQEMAEYTQALRGNAQPPLRSQDTQCHLPPDALEFCLQIQTLIGGNMKRFARQLLGKCLGEGPDAPGFASTQEFWRMVEMWVQESEPSDVSKAALQKACQGLHPSPLDDRGQPLQEMALVDRLRLERNFKRMRENVLMTPLVDELRTSELLTEDARHFLLEKPLPRSQLTARLCDVIISWGEKGLPALIRALQDSDQGHVAIELQKEPQQAALPEESTARQGQQSQAACPDTEAWRPLTKEGQRFLEELENISRPASVRDLETLMKKQQYQLEAIAAAIARLHAYLQADTEDRRGFKMDFGHHTA